MLSKIFKVAIREIVALFEGMIVFYPVSLVGNLIRRKYWAKKFRLVNVRYFGRAALIVSEDKIKIGQHFVLEDYSYISNSGGYGIYIGNYVGLARNCFVRTANHVTEDINIPWMDQAHTSKKIEYEQSEYSIVIEDDVWVGAHAVILSGSHIGKGCVISAGTVVSSVIPPYSIVAGNPGRVIKSRLKTN